ncbi:DNA polymerase III subunit delta [Tenuibacillus multivorans]|nr:DNA polymerase III subunit delta [Tenuibacillus multivorans]GEL78338.1 hypothetical protein TMU01_25730 [Tenuibacillus multivorans]
MHAQQFIQSRSIKLAPIYVLYGDENYFIQEVKKRIESHLSQHEDEMDRNTYDMENVAVQEALHDAETFPFFSEHKFIEIQQAYFLTGQKVNTDVEHDIEALEEYVQQPVEFTTLIVIAPYEKLDQRKKVVKSLKKTAEFIECTSPKIYEMGQFIKEMAQNEGLPLNEPIVDLMVERVGDHIEAVKQELEKLKLYFKDEPVTYEGAEQIISTHAEANTFSLIDHLVDLKLGDAIQVLKALQKQNEEPIALLALVSQQIRLILQAKLLKQKGYQQQQMAQQLQVHPYAVKMALKRENRFSAQALKDMIKEAALTDEKMKTGKTEQWLALELFLQQVVQRLKQAS